MDLEFNMDSKYTMCPIRNKKVDETEMHINLYFS